jgi:hypothetical protein
MSVPSAQRTLRSQSLSVPKPAALCAAPNKTSSNTRLPAINKHDAAYPSIYRYVDEGEDYFTSVYSI